MKKARADHRYRKPVPWTYEPDKNNPWASPLEDMEEERKTMEAYRKALAEAAKKIVPTEPPPDPSPFDIL